MADASGPTPARPTLAARICRRIVRLYPRAWRRRYEAEVLDVVAQGRSGWRECGDVARGAVTEWASPPRRARVDERHMRDTATRVLIALGKAFLVLCLAGIGIELAFWIVNGLVLAVAHPSALDGDFFGRLTRILPIRRPAPFLLGPAARIGYALLGGGPVALVLAVTGAGRRWPIVSRLLSVAAFLWLDIWLIRNPIFAGATAAAGWVLFAAVFPRRPSASPTPPVAVPRPVVVV